MLQHEKMIMLKAKDVLLKLLYRNLCLGTKKKAILCKREFVKKKPNHIPQTTYRLRDPTKIPYLSLHLRHYRKHSQV